jgi:hypothetical protein
MSRKRLGIGAGLVALGIAGVVLAVVVLGGGGDGKGATSEPTQQTGATTKSTAPAAASSLLAALMPMGIATQCKKQATPSYGAVQTEICRPGANAPTSSPTTFSFSFYRTRAALLRAYNAQKRSLTAGSCGGTKGQKTWIHLSTGKTGGLRVCGDTADGDSAILWTHEKHGSPDHVDMLGVARASSRGANLFHAWWGAVKDNVGKCRPLLPANVCLATVERFEKSP